MLVLPGSPGDAELPPAQADSQVPPLRPRLPQGPASIRAPLGASGSLKARGARPRPFGLDSAPKLCI